MLTETMKLSASQWMLPVEGNGEMARAIRMLQKKVFQMENDLYETSVEDEEILDRMSSDPNVNVFGNERKSEYKASMERKAYQGKAKEEGPRYYYVLRGKYDHKTTSFFRGYVADHQKYEQQQSGTWKFVGNSSRDCEKLTKWIIQNQDIVDKENKTFHNPDGLFSHKWYSIISIKKSAWIRPNMVCINELKADFPKLAIAQPKVHESYTSARAYVMECGGILDVTS